jgi:hypothetical protein
MKAVFKKGFFMCKKTISMLLLSLNFFISQANITTPNLAAVTYTLSGGRLGDDLLSYLHAEWVSYKYNIPLLYKAFRYSNQLALHTMKESIASVLSSRFNQILTLSKGQTLSVDSSAKTLYVIPYFPESLGEHDATLAGPHRSQLTNKSSWAYFEVNWDDKNFLSRIRQQIKPNAQLNLIYPPEDYISIAIHIRKNSGGFDWPLLNDLDEAFYDPNQKYVDVIFPLKHPPMSYYVEQAHRIINLFPDQPFHRHIFTDDPNPTEITQQFERLLNNPRVSFLCRTTDNNHYSNVLEDMFSMTNFDCLVRADSNITIVASKLKDFKVAISPAHHRWEGKKLIIDGINMKLGNQPSIIIMNS